MNDSDHPSELYHIPEYIKDLVFLSQIDYDYCMDSNRENHQEYIDSYMEFMNIEIDGDDIFEDNEDERELAIKIICYDQIIYIFRNLKEK